MPNKSLIVRAVTAILAVFITWALLEWVAIEARPVATAERLIEPSVG